MVKEHVKGAEEARGLLRRGLMLEYELIFYYPRLAARLADRELAQKVQVLGRVSVSHAQVVCEVIRRLGGEEEPPLNLEELPEPLEWVPLFRRQLEKERLALWLHTQASQLVSGELSISLWQIAQQEKGHIALVEEILARLGPGEGQRHDPS